MELNDLLRLPTIMGIDNEVKVIRYLMDMSDTEVLDNKEAVAEVIDNLDLSHKDSGYFEITPQNEGQFSKFADWLDRLQNDLHVSSLPSSSDFRITYQDLLDEYPSMKLTGEAAERFEKYAPIYSKISEAVRSYLPYEPAIDAADRLCNRGELGMAVIRLAEGIVSPERKNKRTPKLVPYSIIALIDEVATAYDAKDSLPKDLASFGDPNSQ
jgi:hypothetical protein